MIQHAPPQTLDHRRCLYPPDHCIDGMDRSAHGAASPQSSTVSVVQAVYEMTFVAHDLGRACAASFLLLGWVALVTLLQRRYVHEERA
jgi:hypothetical protein